MDCVDAIYNGDHKASIYGAGYVGLGLAAVLLKRGVKVILVDIDEEKVSAINSGRIAHVETSIVSLLREGLERGLLEATSDGVKASRESCVKLVTVPVYLDWVTKRVNYSGFKSALIAIARGLKRGDLVIVESSVPPGTTLEVAKPILEEHSGLVVEKDFYLAYSPERVYVGRVIEDIETNYPKVVSGVGQKSLELVSKLYGRICHKGVVKASSTTVAEFEKIAEGIYRDVNIALANQLALACMHLGIDYYEVMNIANTQPYCNLHQPGPGVGGFCIPIYPYFALTKLMERGFYPDLVAKAREINESMPYKVINILDAAFFKTIEKPSTLKIAILGVAFRGDIDDARLSPSHDIVALLKARWVEQIVVHDPYVRRDDFLERLNIELTDDMMYALESSDVVIVATRHSTYKSLRVSEILQYSGKKPFILDTVNVLIRDLGYEKLIVLGVG